MEKRKVNVRVILLVAVLVVALAAALVVLLRLFGSFQSADTAVQTPNGQQTTAPEQPTQGDGGTESRPAAGTLPSHAVGSLTLYYAEGALQEVPVAEGVTSLLPDWNETLPRLDAQRLDGSLEDLTDGELQQLAVGLVQAYYVDAPATGEISAAADDAVSDGLRLELPATDDAPALSARVRFLEAADGLWYVALLSPGGETVPDALTTAYETASAR